MYLSDGSTLKLSFVLCFFFIDLHKFVQFFYLPVISNVKLFKNIFEHFFCRFE